MAERKFSVPEQWRGPKAYVAGAVLVGAGLLAAANFAPGPRDAANVAAPAGEPHEPVSARADVVAAEDTTTAPPPVLSLPQRPVVGADERVPKPAAVRGLYLNAWAAGSARKLDRLIDVANRTEVNAFVIDVKEGGEVSYRTRVRVAAEIGASKAYIPDIQAVIAKLKANGIYPIARIVVFKDAVLARARPDLAVRRADGSIWLDHYGDAWVDSYNRDVWDYNIEIAREAIELGFSEVQWDYVRFPDVPQSYMRTAVFAAAAGRSKEDGIREFLIYSRERLADLKVPVTADVFGLTVSARDDMGIGQLWQKMVDATDVLLPMVYPSHFARGSYGIPHPNSEPYNLIRQAMEFAQRRTPDAAGAASIRPWLQDFTLGAPRYGPAHVRAQIRAVHDAGIGEWVLWNPGSNYTVEALADAAGVAPDLPIPDRRGEPARSEARVVTRRDTVREERVTPPAATVDSARAEKKPVRIWGMRVRPDTARPVRPDTARR